VIEIQLFKGIKNMVQFFVCLGVSISVFFASDDELTLIHSNAFPTAVPVSVFDETFTIEGATPVHDDLDGRVSVISVPSSLHAHVLAPDQDFNEAAFSTPEDLEPDARARAWAASHASNHSSHEPIEPEISTVENEQPPLGLTLSMPPSPRGAVEGSHAYTYTSLSLTQRFKDGAQSAEWEKALAEIPEDVKVVPSPCVQGFKRAYTSFADGVSLFSLVLYGLSGVASGLGGVDYLSNNAFLPIDVMVSVIGLGLIGSALFKYLWVSLSYVKKMDQKRLVSYEKRAEELETGQFTDAQLTEKFERANIFLIYPSYSMVTARQFLFNFICCSETVSSTLLAISGGILATSSASGITGKDLLHMGSQDFYLGMSQGSAFAHAIIYLLHSKAAELKERCEAWLTVQQLAKQYLIQVSGIEKEDIYKKIYKLDDHLRRGRENLLIA